MKDNKTNEDVDQTLIGCDANFKISFAAAYYEVFFNHRGINFKIKINVDKVESRYSLYFEGGHILLALWYNKNATQSTSVYGEFRNWIDTNFDSIKENLLLALHTNERDNRMLQNSFDALAKLENEGGE